MANEDYFPNVQDNFHCIVLDEFVGKEFTAWNDEMIMQFYSTAHFYGDGRIVWMTEGARYESTVEEWAAILGVPEVEDGDIDVYSEPKASHNAMKNMYNEIPAANLKSHMLGSIYFLQAGLRTMNTILRHTLMPKSGDENMFRGYSINMLLHLDQHTRFRVMDLIVETVKTTIADQKRSCGYAPYIQMLINSKLEKHIYALDRPHLPLLPELEDNVVVMDPDHPTSATTQAQAKAARDSSAQVPKTRSEQMDLLLSSVLSMQKDIGNILKNQESLSRIVDTKFHILNNKVDELTVTVNELKKEVDGVPSPHTTDDDEDSPPLRTATQSRTQARSATVPVPECRPSSSAPATASSAPSAPPVPPVATPTPSMTSTDIFADAILSTPSSATGGDHPQRDA